MQITTNRRSGLADTGPINVCDESQSDAKNDNPVACAGGARRHPRNIAASLATDGRAFPSVRTMVYSDENVSLTGTEGNYATLQVGCVLRRVRGFRIRAR